MFAGMAVLGFPAGRLLDAAGAHADAFMFLSMATSMTIGMVGWMVYRGHGWRANVEMTASMFVPTFAVIAVLASGLLTDIGVLMVAEHVAMLLAMLGVMLARPEEYTSCHAVDGMNPPALAAFAVVLALVFGSAAFAGSRIDVHPGQAAAAPEHGMEAMAKAPQAVRGLAVSDRGLTLVLERDTAPQGEPFALAFRIADRRGETVRDFDVATPSGCTSSSCAAT